MEKLINEELYNRLNYLGLIPNDIRKSNIGKSNYSKHVIQPWSIWLDYPELTSWDHDIIKRVLRTKKESEMSETESRIMDYEKIIHICNERIRQLKIKSTEKIIDSSTKQEVDILYPLTGEELKRFNEFKENHKNCKGQIVKQMCYSSGIGLVMSAHCTGCNETKDITDYSKW